jgi:hypothetical protein
MLELRPWSIAREARSQLPAMEQSIIRTEQDIYIPITVDITDGDSSDCCYTIGKCVWEVQGIFAASA